MFYNPDLCAILCTNRNMKLWNLKYDLFVCAWVYMYLCVYMYVSVCLCVFGIITIHPEWPHAKAKARFPRYTRTIRAHTWFLPLSNQVRVDWIVPCVCPCVCACVRECVHACVKAAHRVASCRVAFCNSGVFVYLCKRCSRHITL